MKNTRPKDKIEGKDGNRIEFIVQKWILCLIIFK